MNIAVLTYQYVTKPTGMPDAWPAEIVELNEGVAFPPDQRVGWVQMTQAQYTQYLITYQSAYDTYAATIPNQTPVVGDNYLVSTYNNSNQLSTETWYRDKLETGSYATISKQNVYTYSGNSLLRVDTNYYTVDGNIYSTESVIYISDSNNKTTYTEKTT